MTGHVFSVDQPGIVDIVAVAGLPEAAREGKPHRARSFQASVCVTFSSFPSAQASRSGRLNISVHRIYAQVQTQGGMTNVGLSLQKYTMVSFLIIVHLRKMRPQEVKHLVHVIQLVSVFDPRCPDFQDQCISSFYFLAPFLSSSVNNFVAHRPGIVQQLTTLTWVSGFSFNLDLTTVG